eukprot:SAG11_NODE_14099_length_625_cov_0.937262_1_plen_36_part_01
MYSDLSLGNRTWPGTQGYQWAYGTLGRFSTSAAGSK